MSDETLKLPGLPEPYHVIPGMPHFCKDDPVYSADQLRELQRQTVEVCAKVCERRANSCMGRYGETMAHGIRNAAAALRELLKDQS